MKLTSSDENTSKLISEMDTLFVSYIALISFYFLSALNKLTIADEYNGSGTMLIIGLGNPGKEYSLTKHNIGFTVVDELVNQYHSSFSPKKKFFCDMSVVVTENQKLIFVKPTTYMNLSGKSVISIKTYYNISLRNIFVIHDDIDLHVGRIKIKYGGSNGGHNGLKSIDQAISNWYNRIRIGVGRPQGRSEVSNYVLNRFDQSGQKVVQQAIDKIVNNFNLILDYNKWEEFRNTISRN